METHLDNESAGFTSYVRGKEAPRALFFYLLLIALLYAPVVFSGKTLLPGNYYPHGVIESWPYDYEGRTAKHTLSIDLATPAYFEFPMNKLIGDQYRGLSAPLWNPYQGAGTPLAAQYSSKAFFPYQILENISPVWLWDFFLLGRLLLAGIFTFLFLRAIRLSFSASFLGGVFYMFSGTFVWFINLEQMVNVAMVAPLLLLCMEALSRRGRYKDVAVSAITFALVLLAGQPETALYVLFLGALYFALRLITAPVGNPKAAKLVGKFVCSYLIGLLLAAPVIVPFVELWANAHHIHPAGGEMGVVDTNPIERAVNILTPTFYERPLDPLYSRHPLAEVSDSLGAPHYSKFFPNNGEWDYLGGYSGVTMLFLSLAGVIGASLNRRKTQKILAIFFFAFGLSIVLKNFGVLPFLWLGKLPLFDQVWSQRWAGPVWTLAFAVSGALGFEIIKDFTKPLAPPPDDGARARTLFPYFRENREIVWGVVVHAVLCWVAFMGALAIFSFLVGLFSGEPLSTLRVFAVKTFFLPCFVVFLIAYIVGHRMSGELSERLTLRGYSYVIGISAVIVNLAVILISALGLVESSADVYIGGIEVHIVIILSFAIVAFLLAIWKWMSLYTEERHNMYKAVGFATLFILIFYFYAFESVPKYAFLSGHFFKDFYFPSIFMGKLVTVGSLLLALLASLLFIRRSIAIYAIVGVAIIELWFVIPRAYGFEGLNLKLIPLAFGLAAILFMALKWWRVFGAVAIIMLISFIWIDSKSDYGFPERYDPFTSAPYVKFLKAQDGYYRSMGSYGVLFPNYASAVGLHDVRFINSLAIGAFQDFRIAHLHNEEVSRETSSALWFTGRPELHIVEEGWIDVGELGAEVEFRDKLKFYSMLSVKYFLAPADMEIDMKGFPLIYDKEVKIYENRSALPRAYMVHKLSHTSTKGGALEMIASEGFDARMEAVIDGEATYLYTGIDVLSTGGAGAEGKITSFDFNRVEIEVNPEAAGLLVLTDAWYPGWRAYVDGVEKPIVRVNSVVRGVAVPAGAHTIIFKYCPRSFTLAMILFAVSLAGVIVLIVLDRSRVEV
ncbi:MAG: YfhO family protein [Thermodesulfobacteriota bacterium]